MRLHARTASLRLAREFAISRHARRVQDIVWLELEHEDTTGLGEATPVYYRGETAESALTFLRDEAPTLIGHNPWALEAIGRRLRARPGEQAAKAALDAALHDWIGKRLGQPVWRLLGLEPVAPPTSYTIGIDTLEGTRERTRDAHGFRALKVKLGRADDLARLRLVRAETDAPIRVDANEGWTLDAACALLPALNELGVELVEQPFPAHDRASFEALRSLRPRPPILVDEGCHDVRDVSRVAAYADGIVIKIAKAGGIRDAIRMIHTARALGLRVMLGCMVESELGIAPAAHIASLVDWVDTDGHLLLADRPCVGLELRDGRVLPSHAPGLGVRLASGTLNERHA
jgi:L-alanine-DL-glutamate epimerase-like enolase superfamily enzyme